MVGWSSSESSWREETGPSLNGGMDGVIDGLEEWRKGGREGGWVGENIYLRNI